MSISDARTISLQFGACNCVAWTAPFPKLLEIQPFVWNGGPLAGKLLKKNTGCLLCMPKSFPTAIFSCPKKVTCGHGSQVSAFFPIWLKSKHSFRMRRPSLDGPRRQLKDNVCLTPESARKTIFFFPKGRSTHIVSEDFAYF